MTADPNVKARRLVRDYWSINLELGPRGKKTRASKIAKAKRAHLMNRIAQIIKEDLAEYVLAYKPEDLP